MLTAAIEVERAAPEVLFGCTVDAAEATRARVALLISTANVFCLVARRTTLHAGGGALEFVDLDSATTAHTSVKTNCGE